MAAQTIQESWFFFEGDADGTLKMAERVKERDREEVESSRDNLQPPEGVELEEVDPSQANPAQQAWIYDLADRINVQIHHVRAHDHERMPDQDRWAVSTSPTAVTRGMLPHMTTTHSTKDGAFYFTLMVPQPGVDINQHFPVETGASSEPQVSK